MVVGFRVQGSMSEGLGFRLQSSLLGGPPLDRSNNMQRHKDVQR